jgi:hypothetical protein
VPSKRLQGLRIDVALLTETSLKLRERFFVPNRRIYRTDRFLGRKGGTALSLEKTFRAAA